jgi:hypothetical protein
MKILHLCCLVNGCPQGTKCGTGVFPLLFLAILLKPQRLDLCGLAGGFVADGSPFDFHFFPEIYLLFKPNQPLVGRSVFDDVYQMLVNQIFFHA